MDNDDAIVQVLSEHEHVIDCIVWATTEACRTIESANYSGYSGEENKDGNDDVNGEVGAEEGSGGAAQEVIGGGGLADDESRATMTTRMTTKERIQMMKNNLKSRREAMRK